MAAFFVYILWSDIRKKYYVGQTQDINKRLLHHNAGESKYTKHGSPWKLVYQESFVTRAEAIRREKYLKSMKSSSYLRQLIEDGQ